MENKILHSNILTKVSLNILLLGLLLSLQLYYFWGANLGNQGAILCFLSSLFLLRRSFKRVELLFLFLIFTFYFISALTALKMNAIGKLFTLMHFSIFFVDTKYFKYIYEKLELFFAISFIPSFINYFIVIWLGIDLSYSIIEPLNALKDYSYLRYAFCVMPDESPFSLLRFCGYYDEPGVVGTISGFFLIINRCSFKRWQNWVFIIVGIFSFSLYFYLLVILYVILFGQLKLKLLFAAIIVSISVLLSTNPITQKFIFSRLDFSEGEFSGDNRTSHAFDNWYDSYLKSSKSLVGYGRGMSLIVDEGGASYKHLIVDNGLIMTSLFILSVLSLSYVKYGLSRFFFIYCLLFLSLIYQRPYVYHFFYLFLILVPNSLYFSVNNMTN